ncbi:MAG: stage III sporulation protein AE [Clostridia bacterium]
MKKRIVKISIFILLSLIFFGFCFPVGSVFAEVDKQDEIIKDLEENVTDQLDGLDLSALEKVLAKLGDKEFSFFKNTSFREKLEKILSGEFTSDNKGLFQSIIDLIFDNVLEILPLIISIIAISILCSFISSIRSATNGKSIADIIHFVCFGVIIILVSSALLQVVKLTYETLGGIKGQMEAIFPILFTLLTAIGGTASVGVFQPAVVLLSSGVMQIFTNLIMPIFIFSLVFSIISNLTQTVKLEKFSSFFSSMFKYVIGFIFTIFSAFLMIQGITANSFDGISFKTAKFAIKSYIPIMGGYLSDGLDLILTSSVLIKNAVGASGLFLLFATVLIPIVKIAIFMLALKLAGAILEPIVDNRVSNFVSGIAKSMNMLISVLLGVSFMYFLTVGALMCTANFV